MIRIISYRDPSRRPFKRLGGLLFFILFILFFAFCASLYLQMRGASHAETPDSLLHGDQIIQNEGERAKLLSVPYISQKPDFPTGCEAISAVMVLHYYGETVSAGDFIDQYLPCGNLFFSEDGQLCGPDPAKTFVGNPRSSESFGCFAPVIATALNRFAGEQRVENTTGLSLNDLCEQYLDAGHPVLVWASIGMKATYPSRQWRLEDGQIFTWTANEHCLVLIGYDDNSYYFNDPSAGVVGYDRQTVEARYAELGMQSLVYLG